MGDEPPAGTAPVVGDEMPATSSRRRRPGTPASPCRRPRARRARPRSRSTQHRARRRGPRACPDDHRHVGDLGRSRPGRPRRSSVAAALDLRERRSAAGATAPTPSISRICSATSVENGCADRRWRRRTRRGQRLARSPRRCSPRRTRRGSTSSPPAPARSSGAGGGGGTTRVAQRVLVGEPGRRCRTAAVDAGRRRRITGRPSTGLSSETPTSTASIPAPSRTQPGGHVADDRPPSIRAAPTTTRTTPTTSRRAQRRLRHRDVVAQRRDRRDPGAAGPAGRRRRR